MKNLNTSGFILLGLLSKDSYSGYEIKRILAKTTTFYGSESNAQIYPVLKKLEAQGLVESALDTSSGARNKRVFSLSAKGRAELLKWLEHDCDIQLYRENFLLQLSLGQHLTNEQLIKKLQHYKQSILAKLDSLASIMQHIKTAHVNKPDQKYLLLSYDHMQHMLEAKLQWCEQILAKPKNYL